jgi:hypothetical protein
MLGLNILFSRKYMLAKLYWKSSPKILIFSLEATFSKLVVPVLVDPRGYTSEQLMQCTTIITHGTIDLYTRLEKLYCNQALVCDFCTTPQFTWKYKSPHPLLSYMCVCWMQHAHVCWISSSTPLAWTDIKLPFHRNPASAFLNQWSK